MMLPLRAFDKPTQTRGVFDDSGEAARAMPRGSSRPWTDQWLSPRRTGCALVAANRVGLLALLERRDNLLSRHALNPSRYANITTGCQCSVTREAGGICSEL